DVGHRAQGGDGCARAGESAGEFVVGDGRAPAVGSDVVVCVVDQLFHDAGQSNLVGGECGTAFEGQGRHRHAPAVADLADDIADRDSHVVVEDLAEFGSTLHRLDRSGGDSGGFHVADDPGDALVLRVSVFG